MSSSAVAQSLHATSWPCVCLLCQVFDYDMLFPEDSLLGTAELFFSHESIQTDPVTGGQSVSGGSAGISHCLGTHRATLVTPPPLQLSAFVHLRVQFCFLSAALSCT